MRRRFWTLMAGVALVLGAVASTLWARNAFASDVYTLWWFRVEQRSTVLDPSLGVGTGYGFVRGRWYGPVHVYHELTCRTACGTLVVRFVRGERDQALQTAVETRAAQGLRPASNAFTTSADPTLLARGLHRFGGVPGGATHWIDDPPSPFAFHGWQVGVPFWFAIPALLTPPLLWARGRASRRRLARAGGCPTCGYDLRATPGRCPECGATTAPDDGSAARS